MPECFGRLGKLGRGVYGVREILKVRYPTLFHRLVLFMLRSHHKLPHSPLLSVPISMSLLPQSGFGKSASPRNEARRLLQCNMPMRSCSTEFSSSGVYSYVLT